MIAPSTGVKAENGGTEDHGPVPESDQGTSGESGSSSRRISIYVGNLTWWTSDADVIEAIQSIGITDVSDVKFFENRANGQSKGFCVVNLGSDASVRQVIEKLPKMEIHGQNPAVTPCNRQALNHFEMQSRKMNPTVGQGGPPGQQMGMGSGPRPPYNPNMSGPPAGMRPPLIGRQPRPNGPLLGQPRLPMQQPYGQTHQQWGPRPGGMHSGAPRMRMPLMGPHPGRGQGPLLRAPGPPLDSGRHHPSDWSDHPAGHQGYGNPPMPMRGPPAGSGMGSMSGMHHGHGGHPSGPTNVHLNPAFIQHQGQNHSPDDYNRPSGYMSQDSYRHAGGGDMSLSEAARDEILEKNRSVSHSAVQKAVDDASSGKCHEMVLFLTLPSRRQLPVSDRYFEHGDRSDQAVESGTRGPMQSHRRVAAGHTAQHPDSRIHQSEPQ